MKKLLQRIYLFTFLSFFAVYLQAQPYAETIYVGSSNGSNSANAFFPNNITVNQGDSVLFVWMSGNHVISCQGGCFPNFTLNGPGQKKAIKMISSGTFTYFCTIQGSGNMSGTINVNPETSAPSVRKYELTVSPNPFEDEITLTISAGNKSLTAVRIFDLIGKEVAHIDLRNKPGTVSYKLDFSRLNPGVYFCNVYSETGLVETKKLFRTK